MSGDAVQIGRLRDRAFKHGAQGHRHLMRNKSWRNRKAGKRTITFKNLMDQKKIRRMVPYWKRKRSLN